ncbi:pentatricopeptide repeat-containing protein [Prunus yedoensis var. nudiflora]|uniref:Pentatricopeptide repeat-containing protein n=1 Tax=Prunus yedoensis var. nudiflora TaxID=2094558 RepID=A0A314UH92_PRUYE|nr:pentatricopeptide repeat-containing protein [Prunus yedoensis var. nudiflora]
MNSQELWVQAYGRLKSCKTISPTQLKQFHAFIIKTRPLPLPTQQIINPKLTSSTEKNFTHILSFLNHLEKPDLCLSLYNAIIQGLPSNPNNKASSLLQVLELLKHMLVNGLLPDNYTVPSVLKACAQSRALREGQQMHTYAIKTGLVLSNVYVKNTLMRLYAVCGVINCVRNLFDEGPQRDLVSWTTLIQGYVKMGLPREGVEAFFDMCDAKMRADEMTLVIVLSACSKLGDLSLGREDK